MPIDICGFRWSLSPADSGREFSILSTYVPNDLNQYSPRSMSLADRKADVIGLAAVVNGTPTTVNITVNGGPASGPDYRRGEYFWKAVAASGAGPNWLAVGVTAGSSPTASGGVYVPPQTENFGPDTDGNLISDARWLYKWDAENRLVRIETQPAAAASPAPPAVAVPAKRVQYTYDYRGRMVRRQVFSGTYNAGPPATIGWSSTADIAAGADLIFLYDGWQCVAALKPDQSLFQAYVWGIDLSGTTGGAGGVGGMVMFRRVVAGGTTETYLPTYDGNGNVTGLVAGDGSSPGAVSARYEYGPFGSLLRISGEPVALDNPFRFSSKYHDDTVDLIYYGFRYYNPSTGRWLSRDPIEERGGVNLFAVLDNDLLNNIDALGLEPETKVTKCEGTCGAIIDDWIMEEVKQQYNGYLAWRTKNKDASIETYQYWGNGNQRYKDPSSFQFNQGIEGCGTQPDKQKPGCGFSVTLFGHCVKSSSLGNIIYGLVGQMAGFQRKPIIDTPSNIKRSLTGKIVGEKVDPYDEIDYGFGWDLGSKLFDQNAQTINNPGLNSTRFQAVFNQLVASQPNVFFVTSKNGGAVDPGSCKPCTKKTKATNHGGSAGTRMRP